MTLSPNTSLASNRHRALRFDLDMKFDWPDCISESRSGGRGPSFDVRWHTRFMKLSHIMLILVASAAVVFARAMQPYIDSMPPTMSLPAGYELAVKALGSSTNQFHCIRATVFGAGFADATAGPGWSFTFSTTNTPPKYKWVAVGFDGKTEVKDEHSMTLPE